MSTATLPPLAVMTALADANRLSLLDRLGREGPASATTLARDADMTRQGVLKHLAVLEDARIVGRRRAGREVVFVPSPEPLQETARWLEATTRAWGRRLDDLKRRAEGEE
ncbi:ArsR/SmtB family transcription factor [Aeromicrobium sp. CTD01-1L150]|uniref:ArsR/SmtB family transcription factor n=1 Tax=Aeromicrobium sp. CTD01-1L150 TaxID=3341830 RepID=UPI0035BF3CFA